MARLHASQAQRLIDGLPLKRQTTLCWGRTRFSFALAFALVGVLARTLAFPFSKAFLAFPFSIILALGLVGLVEAARL